MNIRNYDIYVWHPPTYDTCPNFLCKRTYVLKQVTTHLLDRCLKKDKNLFNLMNSRQITSAKSWICTSNNSVLVAWFGLVGTVVKVYDLSALKQNGSGSLSNQNLPKVSSFKSNHSEIIGNLIYKYTLHQYRCITLQYSV